MTNDEIKKFQEHLNTLSLDDRADLSEQLIGRLLHVARWAEEVMIAAPTCCRRYGTCASCKLRDGIQALKDRMALLL